MSRLSSGIAACLTSSPRTPVIAAYATTVRARPNLTSRGWQAIAR